jgi:hypothetical protein
LGRTFQSRAEVSGSKQVAFELLEAGLRAARSQPGQGERQGLTNQGKGRGHASGLSGDTHISQAICLLCTDIQVAGPASQVRATAPLPQRWRASDILQASCLPAAPAT